MALPAPPPSPPSVSINSSGPRPTTLKAAALKPGQRFYCQYEFSDNWQFHGRLHQIPARGGPALWAHARLTDTPARHELPLFADELLVRAS